MKTNIYLRLCGYLYLLNIYDNDYNKVKEDIQLKTKCSLKKDITYYIREMRELTTKHLIRSNLNYLELFIDFLKKLEY